MWRKRAPDYDFENDFHPRMCDQLIAVAQLQPGNSRLLDVASGTGTTALLAARALGPEGVITAVDISQEMIAKVSHTLLAHRAIVSCRQRCFART